MNDPSNRFTAWLNATMERRHLSQAELARAVGVADTQVSRWRRGQVVPTVRSLQRIADTLDVPRATLDRLAGYPMGDAGEPADDATDPEAGAELQAHAAWYRELLKEKVPRALWPLYTEACAALAEALAASFREGVQETREQEEAAPNREEKRFGFRR